MGGIVLLVLVGAGSYMLGAQSEQNKRAQQEMQITPTNPITPSATGVIPTTVSTKLADYTSNWKTYKSGELRFSIKHPQDVSDFTNPGGMVSFSKSGPTQINGSEINDGISLRISGGSLKGQSLNEFMQKEIKGNGELQLLKPISQTSINNLAAYTFKLRGLGEFTYFYIPVKDNEYIEIVDSTVDPTNQGYHEIVDQMLSTFKLEE
ncbi:MAG TPA: hypothetical protein VK338_03705 [Candidatus Nitrosocosmicus sp.]|nr:hypothetical protein [Candidatus Nitrosocosmicus sp.]